MRRPSPPRLAFSAALLLSGLVTAALEASTYTMTAPTVTKSAFPDPTAEPTWTQDDQFQESVLNSTNLFRQQHDAKPLVWNDTMAKYARDYLADNGCDFKHSGGPYGENLAMGNGFFTPAMAIDAWGNERQGYSWDRPRFSSFTGHFTQLVWKNSTDVGCDRRLCGQAGGYFLVCEYSPPGNVEGQFSEMVGPQVAGLGAGHRSSPDAMVLGLALAAWLSWILVV